MSGSRVAAGSRPQRPRAWPHRRLRPASAGARWAVEQLAELRTKLGPDGLSAVAAPPPPAALRRGGLRGARVALAVRRATCLERALIVQAWLAAAGAPLDVVIGVRGPNGSGARAHAWVDRYDDDESGTYAEIRRVPAPGPG